MRDSGLLELAGLSFANPGADLAFDDFEGFALEGAQEKGNIQIDLDRVGFHCHGTFDGDPFGGKADRGSVFAGPRRRGAEVWEPLRVRVERRPGDFARFVLAQVVGNAVFHRSRSKGKWLDRQPGRAHTLRPMIGVDFGGTSIKAGFIVEGRVVRSSDEPTPQTGRADDVLDAIARAVHALDPAPISVGVAIPGEVDSDGRCWGLPNVPGFKDVNIGGLLSERLGCPVAVENDATTAALGEYLYGHGTRYPSFLMVTLGTGVGGGLVLGGQLYPGSNGFAGEIGHVNVDRSENAVLCGCGRYGCLETYTGTAALKRMFRTFGGHEAADIKEIADAARAGVSAGLATFETMGEWLGRGLAGIQNVLDLNALIVTGGISKSFDLIEPSLRAALRTHCCAAPLAEVPVVVSVLGSQAGVIGAAHLPQLGV